MRQVHPVGNGRIDYCSSVQLRDKGQEIGKAAIGARRAGAPGAEHAGRMAGYVSCWLKRYEPAAFTFALLNSQPMGFYAPAQLVQDAQRHGVEVRPVDVLYNEWDCDLEVRRDGEAAPSSFTLRP